MVSADAKSKLPGLYAVRLTSLAAVLLLGGCSGLNPFEIQPTFGDLAYGDHARQKLDLYLPESAGQARPLVVWIHGGRWNGGEKYRAYPAQILTDAGFAVASIDYRFSSDAPFPAQIYDCKGAIRWLRAHASDYGLDPDRIGVWGRSAGGHLAALVGTTGDLPDLEGDVGGNLDCSSRVQAAADYYGPTDAFTFAEYADDCGSGEPPLLGRCLGEIMAHVNDPAWSHWVNVARLASPVYSVTPDDPPFFIGHGTADTRCPPSQSQELYDRLIAAGVQATLDLVPNAEHGQLPVTEDARVVDFFRATLGESPTNEYRL
jgi:acetyl esterase/lipase